jgi:hypothetical protein
MKNTGRTPKTDTKIVLKKEKFVNLQNLILYINKEIQEA